LLQWGDPWLTMVQPMPYVAVQQLIDASYPWGIREYAKIAYLPDLSDEAIDAMMLSATEARSPFSEVILCPLGGAVSRMDKDTMALNVPDTNWLYFCMAKSWDPDEQEKEITWARAFMAAMRPWSVDQAPPNFLDRDEGARVVASYGEEKFGKLVALKDKYDPENVFSLNVNIPPSASS